MAIKWAYGLYDDNWVSAESSLEVSGVSRVEFSLYIPEIDEGASQKMLSIIVNFHSRLDFILKRGELNNISVDLDANSVKKSELLITCDAEPHSSGDVRSLGFVLNDLNVISKSSSDEDSAGQASGEQNTEISYIVFPDYRATNPYQKMIEQFLPQEYEIDYLSIDDAIIELKNGINSGALRKWVFHLHWTTSVMSHARNITDARKRATIFISKLETFVRMGGKLIWTIHNTVPHNTRFEAVEISLRSKISQIAHIIHVHSKESIKEIENSFSLPHEKVSVIRHPSYLGVYPNYVTKEAARETLGFDEDEFCFLFIGQLRPYKGLDKLTEAIGKIRRKGRKIRLIIAGKSVLPYKPRILEELISENSDIITLSEGFVRDEDLQIYFNAADVCVFPYKSVLTSGSVLASLSFGTPVIAPAFGSINETIEDEKTGWKYNPEKDQLAKTMLRAFKAKEQLPSMSENCIESAKELSWADFCVDLDVAIQETLKPARSRINEEISDVEIKEIISSPKEPAKGSVAVIVVSYGDLRLTKNLLASLSSSDDDLFDVYIVDNNSPSIQDDEFRELATTSNFSVNVYRLSENTGYAKGNNIGLRIAETKGHGLFWILNPDTIVEASTLRHLRKFLIDTPDARLVAPKVLYGKKDRRVWSAGGVISFENGLDVSHMYSGMKETVVPKHPYQAEYISGASILLRKSVLETVGFIPEEYFLYFEETEWCIKIREKMGDVIYVCPNAVMYHLKASENKGLPTAYYFYYYIRNSVNFTRRHSKENLEKSIDRVRREFITPWLSKISKRRPLLESYYRKIASAALIDGLGEVFGRKFLFTVPKSPAQIPSVPTIKKVEEGVLHYEVPESLGLICPVFAALVIDDKTVSEFSIPAARDGSSVCTINIPDDVTLAKSHSIQIALPDGQLSPLFVHYDPPEPQFRGRIEGMSGYAINGWALNANNTSDKIEIGIKVDGELVSTGIANTFRKDLQRNLRGDGCFAFSVNLPLRTLDGVEKNFELIEFASGTSLYQIEMVSELPRKNLPDLDLIDQERWLFGEREVRFDSGASLIKKYQELHLQWRSFLGKKPKVSIVMPAFNRADTIIESMQSVLEQTFENFELIIVDDGSSDETVEIVSEFVGTVKDSRIKLLVLKENKGVSAARNFGLAAAKGKYIAYLDSDNVWTPNYLETMLVSMSLAGSNIAYSAQLIFQSYELEGERIEEPVSVRGGKFSLSQLENRNFIDLNCFMHSKKLYSDHGGFNEDMTRLVDWELIMRYSRVETPTYVPALLSHYFMDKASNQITKTENHGENLKKFIRSRNFSQVGRIDFSSSVKIHLFSLINLDSDVERERLNMFIAPPSVEKVTFILYGKNYNEDNFSESQSKRNNLIFIKEFEQVKEKLLFALDQVSMDGDLFGFLDLAYTTNALSWNDLMRSLDICKGVVVTSPTILHKGPNEKLSNFVDISNFYALNSPNFDTVFLENDDKVFYASEFSSGCFLTDPKTMVYLLSREFEFSDWGELCSSLANELALSGGRSLVSQRAFAHKN